MFLLCFIRRNTRQLPAAALPSPGKWRKKSFRLEFSSFSSLFQMEYHFSLPLHSMEGIASSPLTVATHVKLSFISLNQAKLHKTFPRLQVCNNIQNGKLEPPAACVCVWVPHRYKSQTWETNFAKKVY